ncbi:hypothetical protein [Microvirga tunisiensis]|uniref:Uncharacterized protein n=1 Tax=Microvirga tunisiensis TaxID=2108360 RepID=A0A5N7MIC5_9HYPH|nr:hypothetical protein [Microvirga tunisiensis]MPR08236.1 hypothetical protein [Microvirga tunisiensis]MPR26470.1 hypothetical protein [Microvirga tunisiensis]
MIKKVGGGQYFDDLEWVFTTHRQRFQVTSCMARLGGEIDGDELSGFRIEDGHESLVFYWWRRNA